MVAASSKAFATSGRLSSPSNSLIRHRPLLPWQSLHSALATWTFSIGPFLKARFRSQEYLLSLEPDRMLHTFRINAGLPPKAKVYRRMGIECNVG